MTVHSPIGLSIRNATRVYPGTRALETVDFDIRMGAVNVLVGENGAGKIDADEGHRWCRVLD